MASSGAFALGQRLGRIFVEHEHEELRSREQIDHQRDVVFHRAVELALQQTHRMSSLAVRRLTVHSSLRMRVPR